MKGQELEKRFEYEFQHWKGTTGFEPIELIASENNAGSYEKSELHVFKMKRGYAIVRESGCSCYEASDASIDILPSLKAAKESLRNRAREGYSEGELAKTILLRLAGEL